MDEIGYDGYIGYELCHQLPVVDGQTVGIEYADENARLAAEFMRNLIDAAVPSRANLVEKAPPRKITETACLTIPPRQATIVCVGDDV